MGARGPRPETPEMQALKGNPGKRKKRGPSIRPTGGRTTIIVKKNRGPRELSRTSRPCSYVDP